MDWLGDTREKIGFEKAHIYRSGKPAICSDPSPPQSLLDHAAAIGADLWLFSRDFNYSGDRQQWAYGGREQPQRAGLSRAARANQLLNASAALAALESVRELLPVPQQAVRMGLLQASLPGRFQILPGQPAVILDVAHNPHAAAVLAQNLDNMGFHPYTHAVFGMLNDKDLAGVVAKLGSRVDHLRRPAGPRGASGEDAAGRQALPPAPAGGENPSVQAYADPAAAFSAARERAAENDRIVVFGSFLTVASVLQALGRKGQERGQSGLDSVHRQGGGKPPRRPPKGAARNSSMGFQTQRSCRPGAVLQTGGRAQRSAGGGVARRARRQAGRRDRVGPGGRHRAAHGARFPAGSGCGQYPHQGAGTQHAVPAPGKRAAGRAARRPRRAQAASGAAAPADPTGTIPTPPPVVSVPPPVMTAQPRRPPAPRRRRPRRSRPGRTPSLPPSPIPSPIPSPPPSRKRVPTTAPRAGRCSRAAARLPPRRPPQSRPRPHFIAGRRVHHVR